MTAAGPAGLSQGGAPVASPPRLAPAVVRHLATARGTAERLSRPHMEPTVLLADNDAAVSALLAEVLRRRGLQVDTAFDGEAARRMVRLGRHRVFVCDLDMPKVSGLEVLESLRDVVDPPPTMVISGYLDARIEARLAKLPFVCAVLRKPFDLMRFAEQVWTRIEADGACAAGERGAARRRDAAADGEASA